LRGGKSQLSCGEAKGRTRSGKSLSRLWRTGPTRTALFELWLRTGEGEHDATNSAAIGFHHDFHDKLVLGVSVPYAADIRAGRRRPHPRYWQALARIIGVQIM